MWQFNSQTFLDIFFLFSSISIFIISYNFRFNIYFINISLIIFYFLFYFNKIKLDFTILSFLTSKTSTTETNISSFLFTILSLYFFYVKKYKWFFINLIMIILTYKRITFSSFVIVFLFINYNTLLKKHKPTIFIKLFIFVIILNYLYVYFSYMFGSGYFDRFIYKYIGLSPGYFTQGRSTLIYILTKYIKNDFYKGFFIGYGQGFLPLILQNKLRYTQLIHNDVFKLFFEHGIFIFTLFFYFLYKYFNLFLALILNLFMLTDNILIYTPVIILLILLQHTLLKYKSL